MRGKEYYVIEVLNKYWHSFRPAQFLSTENNYNELITTVINGKNIYMSIFMSSSQKKIDMLEERHKPYHDDNFKVVKIKRDINDEIIVNKLKAERTVRVNRFNLMIIE